MTDSDVTLPELADRCAVLTMECQRGVIGDLAIFPALGEAATTTGATASIARLTAAAHRAGVPVVHAVFAFEEAPDAASLNAPLLVNAARTPIMSGSDAAEVAPEIGPEPHDQISARSTGVSPFTGTDLHERLVDLGVSTLVVCGVSLNVGLPGLCAEAVNLGYRVLLPTDAVVGLPVDFGRDVVRFGLAQLATLVTVDDVEATWAGAA